VVADDRPEAEAEGAQRLGAAGHPHVHVDRVEVVGTRAAPGSCRRGRTSSRRRTVTGPPIPAQRQGQGEPIRVELDRKAGEWAQIDHVRARFSTKRAPRQEPRPGSPACGSCGRMRLGPERMERMSVEIVPAGVPSPAARPAGPADPGAPLGPAVPAGLWARGAPAFVAWEVAGDHQRCFGGGATCRHGCGAPTPSRCATGSSRAGRPRPCCPAYGLGRARGREVLPAARPARGARVLRRRGHGDVSVFLLRARPASATAGPGTSRGLHVRLVRAPAAAGGGGERARPTSRRRRSRSPFTVAATAPAAASAHRRPVDRPGRKLLEFVRSPGGAVAQLGARVNGIHEVAGSIPASSTKPSPGSTHRDPPGPSGASRAASSQPMVLPYRRNVSARRSAGRPCGGSPSSSARGRGASTVGPSSQVTSPESVRPGVPSRSFSRYIAASALRTSSSGDVPSPG
jgi:hypothetical protein